MEARQGRDAEGGSMRYAHDSATGRLPGGRGRPMGCLAKHVHCDQRSVMTVICQHAVAEQIGGNMAPPRSHAHQKVDEAEAHAHMTALAQNSPRADEEAAKDLWLEAEKVVETYIGAAESRSTNMPGTKELGEACFWLLFMSGNLNDDAHYHLVVELLTPGRGHKFFALLPRVRALRDAVFSAMEPQPKGPSADSTAAHHPTEDDIF